MATMILEQHCGVYVLRLLNAEHDNTFDADVLAEYHAVLDQLDAVAGNASLLLYCDHEKTFSTGINLAWMTQQSPVVVTKFRQQLERFLQRLALLNMPTVCAINGNCYAAAAIMACCFDFRLMRADRGRFCFPEVNIKIPFTPIMLDIINLLPNKQILKYMALTGAAYTGDECYQHQIVDEVCAAEQLFERALAFAAQLAEKDRPTYTAIKRGMRQDLVASSVLHIAG